MKSKLFLALIFFSSLSNCDIEFNVGHQTYTEAQKNEIAPCRKYWGKDLISCMEGKFVNKEFFKRNLYFLDDAGQRNFYFSETLKSAADYEKLENVYEGNNGEVDWQKLWTVMNKEEKEKHFRQADILLAASSFSNLKSLIKHKKDKEIKDYEFKRNCVIGVTVVCVVGGILIFTPVGPIIVSGTKAVISAAGSNISAGYTAATSSNASTAAAAGLTV